MSYGADIGFVLGLVALVIVVWKFGVRRQGDTK